MERPPLERLLLTTDDAPRQAPNGYELLVDAFAFSAKAYWAMWGPLGMPMIDAVDRWAERQRGYVQVIRNGS